MKKQENMESPDSENAHQEKKGMLNPKDLNKTRYAQYHNFWKKVFRKVNLKLEDITQDWSFWMHSANEIKVMEGRPFWINVNGRNQCFQIHENRVNRQPIIIIEED
jgi:hypothetical protein